MGRSVVITFRLRPGRDTDIINALDGIPENIDRSEEIRAALRAYYNLGNTLPPLGNESAATGITPRAAGLKIDSIELERNEKSAEELEGALDNLLFDF